MVPWFFSLNDLEKSGRYKYMGNILPELELLKKGAVTVTLYTYPIVFIFLTTLDPKCFLAERLFVKTTLNVMSSPPGECFSMEK